MLHRITVLPQKRNIEAAAGENLLQVLRRTGLTVDAPCGGNGSCGKCKVVIDGKEVLACQTRIDRAMTVTLPDAETVNILTGGAMLPAVHSQEEGFLLAFDIGTTTVAAYLLEAKTCKELACESMMNPQAAFGADIISRIQHALHGHMDELTAVIRKCIADLASGLCKKAGITPGQVTMVSIVGNPAMQQIFLGFRPDNLAQIPFAPVLTEVKTQKAQAFLPICGDAALLIVPNISGFVGADTVACILATGMHNAEEMTLLVDIGTNGEMVLGNKHRMVACSAAAGPALEGANIQFGMRGQPGAIDHVRIENGQMLCSVIGGGTAVGICGSGLIDAVAAALEMGLLNARGKILTADSFIHLTEAVYLTQEDIRQVQLSKGAIAAGIRLMADHLGVSLRDIDTVHLAGAFGTYMDPESACRIGLLPEELADRITAVGNAAGGGARILACSRDAREWAQEIVSRTEALELAAQPGFPRIFARNMRF